VNNTQKARTTSTAMCSVLWYISTKYLRPGYQMNMSKWLSDFSKPLNELMWFYNIMHYSSLLHQSQLQLKITIFVDLFANFFDNKCDWWTYKNMENFDYSIKPSHATTKSTLLTVSKDEWDTKKDTGKCKICTSAKKSLNET